MTFSCARVSKSGKITTFVMSVLAGLPITALKSNVSSSHWFVTVLATRISPVDALSARSNLIPTLLITGFQTLILTIALLASSVKVGRSCVTVPANGWPATRAVNSATVAEVLAPLWSGLAMICSGGLSPFSKTSHVKPAPVAALSKSTVGNDEGGGAPAQLATCSISSK